MNSKYIFTGVTKVFEGITLRQIKRISDGLIGGWIEKEFNLSINGNAWVYGNAQVGGNARVYGNARVGGNARITLSKHYIILSNLTYNITVTPQNAVIGCQIKTHQEWLAVTRKEAVNLGLPINKFTVFKTLLTLLFKEVK